MSQVEHGVIRILEKSLEGADADRDRLLEELNTIRDNSDRLREIIYKPYHGSPNEAIPREFSDPETFLGAWDQTDKALGNTILMIMPPSIFQEAIKNPGETEAKSNQQPVIVVGNQKAEAPTRQPTKGFFAGIWDYQIEKLKVTTRKAEKPTITTEKVTYNPKDVVYQLIPSLNEIKNLYFQYLRRHLSSDAPSIYLVKLGHMRLQEEMSKYFNVVNPFSYASIAFQIEKIRRDKLQQTAYFSRIAQAEAEAKAHAMPYIPPEVRALARAMGEGRIYSQDGFSVPSSDEVAKRRRRKKQ